MPGISGKKLFRDYICICNNEHYKDGKEINRSKIYIMNSFMIFQQIKHIQDNWYLNWKKII